MDDGVYTARLRDVVRPGLFGRRPDRRDLPYRLVIRLALVVFRAFGFRFELRGSAHLPPTGGVLLCSNHVSYFDFTFLGLGALPRHRLVRFMAKSSVFDHWFAGRFMRAMRHIPVDRAAGTAAFETSVQALQDGQVVGIFPEATISRSFTVKNLKAGVARMAIDAQVPIVPAAVWGGQRVATKARKVTLRRGVAVTVLFGEPLVPQPGEKVQQLLRRTKAAMEALLEDAQQSYPQQPAGPDDRWWLPARMGARRRPRRRRPRATPLTRGAVTSTSGRRSGPGARPG